MCFTPCNGIVPLSPSRDPGLRSWHDSSSSLLYTVALFLLLSLWARKSSWSWSQACLTLCNLRVDACVGLLWSGISLAERPSITWWKSYFSPCQSFRFKAFRRLFLSASQALVYGFVHVHVLMHTHDHMLTLNSTHAGFTHTYGHAVLFFLASTCLVTLSDGRGSNPNSLL